MAMLPTMLDLNWTVVCENRSTRFVWLYVFSRNGNVRWKDEGNGMTGNGTWQIRGDKLTTRWYNSATTETWKVPIDPRDWTGTCTMKNLEYKLRAVARNYVEEIQMTRQEYESALGHVFPGHALDQVASTIDGIGDRAAQRAASDPRFVEAYRNGNWTLAGTLYHSAAAKEARAVPQSALPTGWRLQAEEVIQSGAGGSRADILLHGPGGQKIEIDWKTTGASALKSVAQMDRHAGQIRANAGGKLTMQESRSWLDYVRPRLGAPRKSTSTPGQGDVLSQLEAARSKLLHALNLYSNEHKAQLNLMNQSIAGFWTNRLFNTEPPQTVIWNNVFGRIAAVQTALGRQDIKEAFKQLVLARLYYLAAMKKYLTWKEGIPGAGTKMTIAIGVVAVAVIASVVVAYVAAAAAEEGAATAAAEQTVARIASTCQQADATFIRVEILSEEIERRTAQVTEEAIEELLRMRSF